MEGWIKLHRQLKDHWLWKSEKRLKWWIDILLTVNHSDSKVLIKGTLIECKRGQSIRSLESWAKDWNVTKGAVRDFFLLLAKDQMIHTESLQITTRLTVCKYEDYQDELHATETQNKRKGNAKQTVALPKQECKEGEERKEEKELIFNFKQSLIDLGISYKIVSDWLTVRKNKKAINTETAFNEIKNQIELSKLSANECIKIASENSWSGFKAKWLENLNNTNNGQIINNNSKGKLSGTYKAAENFAREIEEKNRNFVSPLFKSE